jgi:hypothetical protein
MGSEVGKWVVDLVGAFDRGMIEKEVDVMPGIGLGDQANLGCIGRRGSSFRVLSCQVLVPLWFFWYT